MLKLKIGDWVNVRDRGEGPGRVTQVIGEYFRANFLKEDGVEYCIDLVPTLHIKEIVSDPAEIEILEKEYKGEYEAI